LAHTHAAEERLQRQRTIAKTRRPEARTTISNPEMGPDVERLHHERSSSDSFIPKLVQRVKEEFYPAPEQKTGQPGSQVNLIDLDTNSRSSRPQPNQLSSFPPLTPEKSSPNPSPSSTNYDLVTSSLARVSISDFKASRNGKEAPHEDSKPRTSMHLEYGVLEDEKYEDEKYEDEKYEDEKYEDEDEKYEDEDVYSDEEDMSEMFYNGRYTEVNS
jgi:hypothetical protein